MIIDIVKKVKAANTQNKRLLSNIAFSVLVKGGALLVSLCTLPAYLRFFEKQEVLGLWFTALSVLSWILTFDLGIGNGLKNHLIEAFANKDIEKAKRYISSAYVITGISVLFISTTGYFLFRFVDWNRIFNISEKVVPTNLLLGVARLIFISVMLQFFFRLIFSILYSLQKSAIPSLLNLLSSVLILTFVLFTNSGNVERNLKMLCYFNILSANLPLLIASIVLFLTTLKKCVPNIKYYNKKYASQIMILGGTFFWLQIMFMMITSTNEFLIAWFVNTAKVVDYKIYNSLFNALGGIFLIALTPVWSEVTEAIVKKEHAWIQKLYKKLKQFTLMAIICEIGLAFSLQTLINLWLKNKSIHIDLVYALICAISGALFIWTAMLTSITNGISELRIALIFLTLGAFINVPLSYLLSNLTSSWISIMLANVFSILPFCVVQSVWLSKYFKRNVKPQINYG